MQVQEHLINQSPLSRAKLLLMPCDIPHCPVPHHPNHGFVVLELDGRKEVMGEVRTRADAWVHLKEFKRLDGVLPQPDFLQAIRSAPWLTGEMPSALFTLSGGRKGAATDKLQVVPMDVNVINSLLRVRGASPAEDRWRAGRFLPDQATRR